MEEEIKNHPENFYDTEYNENAPQRSATAKSCAEPLSQWWIDRHQNWFKPKEENLTFTPQDRQKNALLDKAERSWRSRLDSNRAELLEKIKTTLLSMSEIYRHSRVLVWNADDALLVFDLCRKTPEGATYGVCRTKKGIEILKTYQKTLDDLDKTMFVLSSGSIFSEDNFAKTAAQFDDAVFDRIFIRDCFAAKDDIIRCVEVLKENTSRFSEDARLLLSQRIPCDSQKLSDLILEQIVTKNTDSQTIELLKQMQVFDRKFYSSEKTQIYSWNCSFIKQTLSQAGFKFNLKEECLIEKRRITAAEANLWLDPEKSLYGRELASEISEEGVEKIRSLLLNNISDRIFNWKAANTFWCIKL